MISLCHKLFPHHDGKTVVAIESIVTVFPLAIQQRESNRNVIIRLSQCTLTMRLYQFPSYKEEKAEPFNERKGVRIQKKGVGISPVHLSFI